MGPITLFDKSFLQALNPDEAVWFDHFFLSNISPLFYIETLADLEKEVKKGRSPEKVVGEIANKFPEAHGMPNAHHVDICISNLMGHDIPMTGQILIARGRPVKVSGKTGLVIEESPEAEAFSRWQKGEFLTVERKFARIWRNQLRKLNLTDSYAWLETTGIKMGSFKSLEQVKVSTEEYVNSYDEQDKKLMLCLALLNIEPEIQSRIFSRWMAFGKKPLSEYAPYAAYVLMVELFFRMAIKVGYISSSRSSNWTDIAYLFYLPFSMLFVSSDRLHRRCASLFLRDDQSFIWGPDLKKDLVKINKYYSGFPNGIKEMGINSFAAYPPNSDEFLVTKLWKRYLHIPEHYFDDKPRAPEKKPDIVKEINKFADAPSLAPKEIDFELSNPDAMVVKRLVRKKRGSWYQLPSDCS